MILLRKFFECRPNEVHFYNIVQIMYVPVSSMVKGFFGPGGVIY